MLIPVLVLGILLVLGLVARSIFGTTNRPVFLVMLILVLLVMSGLRNVSVGSDTIRYYETFEMLSGTDFETANEYISERREPLFYILSWSFAKVIPNVQAWFALVSLIYLVGCALICYWESPDYAFSMLYLYCMGLFFFSMTGLRQTLAMGFIMMSYVFVVKRKFIPFLLLVLLARCFHRTSVIFIIIYPIANLKAGWWRLLVGLVVFMVILIFRDSIGAWMIANLPDTMMDSTISSYANNSAGATASGFLIQALMFVFCLRYRKQVVYEVPHREALYNLASVGLIFQAAAVSIAEFFRISMYFNWSFMVLIPICMEYEAADKSYEFLRMLLVLAFCAYFFYSTLYSCGIVPYTFFWAEKLIK